eukprot:704737-Rhodomonas_salina.2
MPSTLTPYDISVPDIAQHTPCTRYLHTRFPPLHTLAAPAPASHAIRTRFQRLPHARSGYKQFREN